MSTQRPTNLLGRSPAARHGRAPALRTCNPSAVFVVLALSAAVSCGCDDGSQRGRFAVSSHSSRAVAGTTGAFTVLSGDPLPLAPGAAGGSTTLMYVLVLAPGVSATGSGAGADNERDVTRCTWEWSTARGKIKAELTWDRRTDVVTVGGAKFDRGTGNAFVLVVTDAGGVSATQAGTVAAAPTEEAALQQIQASLPATSPAKNVALVSITP